MDSVAGLRSGFRSRLGALSLAVMLLVPASAAARAGAHPPPVKQAVAVGHGGAVATVDADATRIGVEMLRRGGNAVDAAVAAAAALGVTEPFSSGMGGGGYFLYYQARTGRTYGIDGRETAPMKMREDAFRDPSTGMALPFDEAVTSGLSVGVPGTPLTWEVALERWGTVGLRRALEPAISLARHGFIVDRAFQDMISRNSERFSRFPSTAELFLPDGHPPPVGARFANPDLAGTYRLLAREGVDALYRGKLGREVVRTVQRPPVAPGAGRPVRPGLMERSDLARYRVPLPRPTLITYRGLEISGMAPSSSGGSTVGEALNILERFDLSAMTRAQALHHELEASRLAFADRNRYVGDPAFIDVPLAELLSDGFAGERACLIRPDQASISPVPPGSPDGEYAAACPRPAAAGGSDLHEKGTTHLVTTDARGDIVTYALTIEQEGGNAMVVPERGFLLNNELTDFNFTPTQGDAADPNLPAPGKRPRSSLSPTIVFREGRPLLAVGSPGGSTIITTVLAILVGRLDLGLSLPDALAAPRFAQRNTPDTSAEPAFLASPERLALEQLGHRFIDGGEIGAATGLEFLDPERGRVQAVAEPVRRGGGSAMVVTEERSRAH